MEIQRDRIEKNEPKFEPIVKGANLWQHFNVRCPACAKLYRIDAKEIKSSQPHFECVTCDTKFTFDFPPKSLAKIETRTVAVPLPGSQISFDEFVADNNIEAKSEDPHLKKCPKCGSQNPQLNTECFKCQVIFGKVENLSLDPKAGAFPSLVKAWQDLFSDYDNLRKHLAFVDRCEDLQALPFALKKYQTLKEAQPHDVVAQRMVMAVMMKTRGLQRVHAKLMKTGLISIGSAWASKVPWGRVRKVLPLVVAGGFMLYGLTHAGARNLIGIGVAVAFLTVGLTIFVKGRISADDFW